MLQNSGFQKYDSERLITRLKEVRVNNHLTQEELAEKLDISRDTVIRWENPKHKALPSLEELIKLCNLYECELSYLLCEQECTIKDTQAIRNYTGLSERAIEVLHEIKLLDENNPSRVSQLIAVNSMISESGLEFLAYIQSVIGAKVLLDSKLAEAPDNLNVEDIGIVADFESMLESCRNHLNIMKDEAIEALRRFMQDSLKLRQTEKAATKRINELISILYS